MNTKRISLQNRLDCMFKNMTTILNSIVNIIRGGGEGGGQGDLYDHLMSTRILTMIMIKVNHIGPEKYEANGYGLDLD